MFESHLKELLSQCQYCGGPCKVHIKTIGSMISMKAKCSCGFLRNWDSQPMHGQMPVGNLIFSAGILFSGSSPSKVLQYFNHTGIQFISIRSYNYIQSTSGYQVSLMFGKGTRKIFFQLVKGTR